MLLKNSLLNALGSRILMLLNTEKKLPMQDGDYFSSAEPTQFVVASYLNPRFAIAVGLCYRFNERRMVSEFSPLYAIKFCSESELSADVDVAANCTNRRLPADAWVERMMASSASAQRNCAGRYATFRIEYVT